MKKIFLLFVILVFNTSLSLFASNYFSNSFGADTLTSLRKGKISFSAGYGLGYIYPINWNIDERIKGKQTGPYHFKLSGAINDFVELGINFNYVETNVLYKENPNILVDLAMIFLNLALYDGSFTNYVSDTNHYMYAFNIKSYSYNARLNFHYGRSKKFDPYFGFGIGYQKRVVKLLATNNLTEADPERFPDTHQYYFPFGFEITGGIRYYPVENVGIYAEIGRARSLAQMGLILRY